MDQEALKKIAVEEENNQLASAIRAHLESRVVSLNIQLQESQLENEKLRRMLSDSALEEDPSND